MAKGVTFSAGGTTPATPTKKPSVNLPPWFDYQVPFTTGGVGGIHAATPNTVGEKIRPFPPVIAPITFPAGEAPTFTYDFYYKIHVDPPLVNVGSIVSDVFIPLKIFNAYFEKRTLLRVQLSGFEGIEVQIDTPLVFEGLETKTLYFKVTNDGPSVINAKMSMFWDTTKDNSIFSIIGSRSVLIPFPAISPYRERLEWLTTIYTTQDGSEERENIRLDPRWSVNADRPCYIGNERQLAQNIVFGWSGRKYGLCMWTESTNPTETVNPGDFDIYCETANRDLRVGSTVLLWSSATNYESVELSEVRSDGVRVARPIASKWVAGEFTLVPTLSAIATGGLEVTGSHTDANLSGLFEIHDPVKNYDGGVFTTYEGLPVCPFPMRGDTAADKYTIKLETVDNKLMNPYRKTFEIKAKRSRPGYYLVEGMADVCKLKEWLWYCRGRFATFWQYTNMNDFTCVDSGQIVTTMRVKTAYYTGMAEQRDHIQITLRDGGVHRAKVLTAVANVDGTETINFDPPLMRLVNEISHVSYLSKCRLDDDKLELVWTKRDRVNVNISIVEL